MKAHRIKLKHIQWERSTHVFNLNNGRQLRAVEARGGAITSKEGHERREKRVHGPEGDGTNERMGENVHSTLFSLAFTFRFDELQIMSITSDDLIKRRRYCFPFRFRLLPRLRFAPARLCILPSRR